MDTDSKMREDGYPAVMTDKEYLQQESEPLTEEDDFETLLDWLQEVLIREEGVGLSAPQIGIQKRVSLVNVHKPIVLVNPRITKKMNKIPYVEGCLSFPGDTVRTTRYSYVEVETDNYDCTLAFGLDADEIKDMLDTDESVLDSVELLEAVCVQHEIDHLDGVLMYDRRWKMKPVEVDKIGRNEKVTIFNPENTKEATLKWKYAQRKIENEGWIMI